MRIWGIVRWAQRETIGKEGNSKERKLRTELPFEQDAINWAGRPLRPMKNHGGQRVTGLRKTNLFWGACGTWRGWEPGKGKKNRRGRKAGQFEVLYKSARTWTNGGKGLKIARDETREKIILSVTHERTEKSGRGSRRVSGFPFICDEDP